ncbi:MAG: TonB-dependent receptor [Acidobacteria bacterium]|nr:TonB-dependent receptor [Acidobacteriota bacterium]
MRASLFPPLRTDLGAWLAALLCSFLLIGSASAQTGTSTVRGTVADTQGQTIAGATVTLKNEARSFSRVATTDSNGAYIFPAIPPNVYVLEVEAKGFKKYVSTDVKALVDTPSTFDVRLEVGVITEVVQVSSAGALTINTQDASLGTVIVNQQIIQLPMQDRDPATLLTLQAGVTSMGYVAGARSDQSNITLDGVDINNAQTNALTAPILRLNAEAIEEFRVTTSNANANQGRSSGAQISLVTKGGTNNFRGSAFYGGRNDIFDANDFFNNRTGVDRPIRRRHFFGGSLGGPIVEDRAFFFYSYEGLREKRGAGVTRTVPLPTLGQGIVRFRDATTGAISQLTAAQIATIFPNAGTNPAAIAALAAAAARYPANDFNAGDSAPGRLLNTAGFRFNALTTDKLNSHIARIDYNLTEKHQFFGRANYIHDLLGTQANFPDTFQPSTWRHPNGISGGHTWTMTSNLVNSFRYGLTRDSFSSQGDSSANAISFRFIFSPLAFNPRTQNRTTPVHNFTDDLSWTKGKHTFQFGTNIRLIRNNRVSFANSYDSAITNPSFYPGGGTSITSPIIAAGINIASADISSVQNAVTAVVGRYTQTSANFIFNKDGSLTSAGSPSDRTFATEEYDGYMQDSWKIKANLTVTYGLRYSISKPVYEQFGFEVKPNISLGEYFDRRIAGMNTGKPYNELVRLDLSGPANGKSGAYQYDKNNFQPRVSASWSPDFRTGLLSKVFGGPGKSVIRGGFAMFNDYYGQALAVGFDLNNTVGFSSSQVTAANTYNLTSNPGPLFTGYDQAVRGLPGVVVPGNITFPRTPIARLFPGNIEGSLDDSIIAPTHYNYSVTIERELPMGMILQASYIGRKARKLLATRDVMSLNNLTDPASRVDWYTAAGQLEDLRRQGTPVTAVGQIPYFANLFPADLSDSLGLNPAYNQTQAVYALTVPTSLGGNSSFYNYGNDYTSVLFEISTLGNATCNPPVGFTSACHMYFQPQWGTLGVWSSVANSDYDAFTLSLRQRYKSSLTMDFNYTLSNSKDDASGLNTAGVTAGGAAFILNPLRQSDNYSYSGFDVRHIINANFVYQLPIGKGRWLLGKTGRLADSLLGGWQLAGIVRYNSGLPFGTPIDDARWATNWQVQSNSTRIGPVETCPTRGGAVFGCNTTEAYRNFRNARAGETGERNVFRNVGYANFDASIAKTFKMPWSEGHAVQFRMEAFNLLNYQAMGAFDTSRSGYGIPINPFPTQAALTPPVNFSRYTAIQGDARFWQFFLRYSF